MFYFQLLEKYFFPQKTKVGNIFFKLINTFWNDATNSRLLYLIAKIFFLGHVDILSGKRKLLLLEYNFLQ